jgi:2-polyprenyl-6-methoxyphenol hydroxylase-like FAD-dependent oxidoreductase
MMNWTERPPEEAFFCLPPRVATVEGGRFAFDLQFQQARSYVQPRVALVGDAAHTVHPMAGQGLNLGLADVDCLFHTIKESYQSGMEVCNTMLFLDRYNSTRQAHVGVTMGGIHALHMAFGLSSETTSSTWWAPPGIFARSLGMNLVNSVGPIRKRLAAVAAGAKFQ